MGTIAEKLTYLNDTRLKIKDGLNKFGADLTENDTFRSYSNVLNDIYNKLPKVSGNGSNFTLENAQNGKLDLFEMEGNTHQDSYTGKNLNVYPYIGYIVSNGIDFNINDDGTILINGQNNNNGNSAMYFYRNDSIIIPAGTTYYIIPPSNTAITYIMYDGTSYYSFNSTNNYSITFNEEKTMRHFYIQISKGNTTIFTNEKIYPMLSTTPVTIDDYEPFVGGSPSPSPDYPQDIKVVTGNNTINVHGKNLFDKNNANIINAYFSSTQTTIALNSVNRIIYIPVKPNTTYTMQKINSAQFYLGYTNELPAENVEVFGITNNTTNIDDNHKYIAITTGANAKYLVSRIYQTSQDTTITLQEILNSIQIEENSTSTDLEPYHNQDYEINLHGKNLFDKENANILNAYIALGNSKITSSNADKCLYIPIKADTTYTISKILSSRFVIGCTDELPVVNTTICNPISGNQATDTTYTITSGNNSQYLVVFYYTTSDTLTEQEILDSIQIEQNSTATEYEEFYDYKLCKIGDYQDSIKKSTGKNLLPYPYPENIKTMNGVTFTVQNDGSILVNGTATAQANIKLFGLQYQDTQKEFPAKYLYGGTNSVRLRALNNTNESYVVLATDTGNGAEIDMSTHNKGYIELTVPNGTTVNNVLIKPMMLNSLDDTTYEPYGEQWYIKKLTEKLKLAIADMNNSEKYPGWRNIHNLAQYYPNTNNRLSYITNYKANIFNFSDNTISINTNNQSVLFIATNGVKTITQTEWKEQYPNLSLEIIYGLQTPIYEKITNETLISQLEAIETETGTNIFEVSNENNVLPSLNVKRLKELEKLS